MSTVIEAQTLRITRRFKAPRERVFAAFTSAEAVSQWFGPVPDEIAECENDFRVGGRYRFKVNCSGEEPSIAIGVYREITPPSKIVYTWKWENDEDWANVESLVTFEFKAVGDETEMHFTHTGFPSDESRKNHTHGWEASFKKLAGMMS